jgi:hypothetical protein
MTNERLLRERRYWIAAVSILLVGSVWLALINAALMLRTLPIAIDPGAVAITVRVLAKALVAMLGMTKSFIVAAVAGTLLAGGIAAHLLGRREEGARRV